MTLDEYIALLQSADARISARNAVLLKAAIEDLKDFGQSIGHERSGNMIESMYTLGPFPIGNGALEASFQSGASYAEEEVKRGGSHDWASRTINEDQARITQLQTEIEEATVLALIGQG